jgi:TolA-binding protein
VLEKRKKISKKQIKEDKLVTFYYEVKNFVLEFQAKILIGAAVIALVVVGVILYGNKTKSDNNKAAGLLAKVIPLYESTSYKEAIDGQPSTNTPGLKSIVDQYGSTENGETAKIYLGNSFLMTGNTEEAFKTFDSYSGKNPLFKATALAAKAGILESRKENDKAADMYKDAATVSKINPANAEYLLKAGIILLNSGKKEEAKSVFDIIKKDYKTSAAFSEVDRYLIQIEG